MYTPPISSRVSEIVHDRLRADIVSGRLAPGDAVPSERTLSEQMGVNRHAVREALKRLQQAGLVAISQGGATRVLDWRSDGGLELLFDLAVAPGEQPDPEIVRGVLEMRASIGSDAARRCAQRATPEQRARVRELAPHVDSEEAHDAYWRAILAGAGNLAYQLALNTLQAGVSRFPDVQALMAPGPAGELIALADAIADGDPERAERLARNLLDPG